MKQPPIKTKELSGSTVQIADGQNWEIASITAYGENAQGGTTDAPVALTGVDSAILFEQHTPINLAKPITADRYGVSVITNADGSVTVKGTATDETWPRLVEVNIPSAIIAGDITISLSSPASVKMQFQAMTPDGRKESYGLSAGSTSITVKIKSGYTGMHIFLSFLPDQTIDETLHSMIAQGTEPVPFVPYVEPSITHLPIPRPLHKVGDVRDICRTRVKSIYDKRIVLDGSLDEAFIQTNIIDGWIQIATESDAVIPESTSIVGSIKSSYLKAYAIEEVYSKKHSGISVDSNRRIRLSFKTSEYPDVTSVETARTYLSAHPLTVYYQSTAYYGTNGLDVCLTEYQTDYIESYADESITTAWISSTGALSTGAEVAYVLSSPETYATDPLDIDNAAGPLTVMTGGEVEVTLTHRMLTPYTAWTIQYDSEGEYTGDFFNVEDYDRIKQNIEYLREYAYFLYGGFTLRGMVAVTVESYGYASTIDALDANLEAIAANTFRPPDMMPVKQWRGNQPPPGANDWNRIENTCLLLFEQFERQSACLPKLAFELKGSAF